MLRGISFHVEFSKEDSNHLAVILINENKKNAISEWIYDINFKAKLLSLGKGAPVEKALKTYFYSDSIDYGWKSFIEWDKLLSTENFFNKDAFFEISVEMGPLLPLWNGEGIWL